MQTIHEPTGQTNASIPQSMPNRSKPLTQVQGSRQHPTVDSALLDVLDRLGPSIFAGVLDTKGLLRYANHAALKTTELEPEQVLGKRFDETPWWQACEHSRRRLQQAIEKGLRGESSRFDVRVATCSGATLAMDFSLLPLYGEDGKVEWLIPSAHDVTDRVDAEHARVAAEAASRAKTAFLANISHELRTPLNAIIGLTYILKRDPREDVRLERLEKIDEAGKHLLKLIDQVLDLSKIEAGKLTLEETAFSLNGLFEKTITMIGPVASSKGLRVNFHPATPDGWVRGDSTRPSQMALNLLSNAVKFTQVGEVTCTVEVISRTDFELTVRCSVADTGEGIPVHAQPDLFEPFEQADVSTTRRFGGTGLGLAITKQLATAMRGSVGLTSHPGQGSTFWFTATLLTLPFFALPADAETK